MNNMKRLDQDVVVEISPQFKGHITPRGIILPKGSIDVVTKYSRVGLGHSGFVARIVAPGYHFEIGFTETTFYIIRNDNALHYPFKSEIGTNEPVQFVASWDTDRLQLIVFDDSFIKIAHELTGAEKDREVSSRTLIKRTNPTIPPYSLLDWARRQSIIPAVSYDTVEQVYEEVALSLESIDDVIRALGSINAFWDVSYAGKRIVSKLPKAETDIHPTINLLLFYIAQAKNLHIVPEYPIGGGRLDFLVSAPLSNGKMAHASIEFKHGHSSDLLKGLLFQLPAYMKAKACEFGIYCVLFFKGDHFDEPIEHDVHSLRVLLETKRRGAGLRGIRTLILNVGHHLPPSKR